MVGMTLLRTELIFTAKGVLDLPTILPNTFGKGSPATLPNEAKW